MSEPISNTSHGDAPLSAARKPDVSALAVDTPEARELVGRSITVNRPRQEVYAVWRNFENLASFMENVEHVAVIDQQRSHWVVSAPAGRTVEWDSVLVEDIRGELIRWRSTDDADIIHSGHIEFRDAPGNRGTEVTATIVYDAPAGKLGKVIAKLFQKEPKIQSRRDLRRFKQLMETGEVTTSLRCHEQPSRQSH